jgi:hypothetical protein
MAGSKRKAAVLKRSRFFLVYPNAYGSGEAVAGYNPELDHKVF